MSNTKTINPLKEIEKQVSRILFSEIKGSKKEVIKINEIKVSSTLEAKQQLTLLIRELKQKHLKLMI